MQARDFIGSIQGRPNESLVDAIVSLDASTLRELYRNDQVKYKTVRAKKLANVMRALDGMGKKGADSIRIHNDLGVIEVVAPVQKWKYILDRLRSTEERIGGISLMVSENSRIPLI